MSPLLSYLLVNPYDSPSFFTPTLGAPTTPSPQLISFLQTVRPRGLIRSVRVKRDLERLMGLHPTDLEVVLAKYPGDKVAEFCTHIRKTIHEKPWTLVSYAWCFYMAVFSGGRWIRSELLRAGLEFWETDDANEKAEPSTLAERGLSFWHFPGQFDGEDIKLEFKAQLAAVETLFTTDERVDIIEEAKNIFQMCAGLVEELDAMVGTDLAAKEKEAGARKLAAEKKLLVAPEAKSITPTSIDLVVRFLRRPEVTGTIMALACFACAAVWRLQ
jgi:heme oxygenase